MLYIQKGWLLSKQIVWTLTWRVVSSSNLTVQYKAVNGLENINSEQKTKKTKETQVDNSTRQI